MNTQSFRRARLWLLYAAAPVTVAGLVAAVQFDPLSCTAAIDGAESHSSEKADVGSASTAARTTADRLQSLFRRQQVRHEAKWQGTAQKPSPSLTAETVLDNPNVAARKSNPFRTLSKTSSSEKPAAPATEPAAPQAEEKTQTSPPAAEKPLDVTLAVEKSIPAPQPPENAVEAPATAEKPKAAPQPAEKSPTEQKPAEKTQAAAPSAEQTPKASPPAEKPQTIPQPPEKSQAAAQPEVKSSLAELPFDRTDSAIDTIPPVAIEQTGHEVVESLAPEPNPQIERKSDVVQELQKLYEQDGRSMPPMNMEQLPNTVPPEMYQSPAPKAQQQQQPSASPAEAETKKPGFLQRIFGKSTTKPKASAKAAPRSTKAGQTATTRKQRPAVETNNAATQPNAAQPTADTRNLRGASAEKDASSVERPTSAAGEVEILPAAPVAQPAPNAPTRTAQAAPADQDGVENPVLLNESAADHPLKEASANTAPTPVKETPKVETKPAATKNPLEETENPFTGAKLDDEAPGKVHLNAEPAKLAPSVEPAPAAPAKIAPEVQAPKVASASDASEKLQRIFNRTGKPGLKGLCPVALRDERELLDAQPEFEAMFHGKSYFFSSAKAKARFIANPLKYAPVADGADVVIAAHSHQSIAGTLEHSLWFRDRLYLFSSAESRQTFISNPQPYVEAAEHVTGE